MFYLVFFALGRAYASTAYLDSENYLEIVEIFLF